MTLPLPANWTMGEEFTADAENAKEAAINAVGDGTLPIPLHVSISSASTLTLTSAYNAYVFNGSAAAAWALPAVAGNTGAPLNLCNLGTATVTVNCAGSDHLYARGSVDVTIPLPVGTTLSLVNDGTYWIVL